MPDASTMVTQPVVPPRDSSWRYRIVATVQGPLGDSGFARVSAIGADSLGHLFVADGDGIHLADKTGRYLKHIARRGQGPGEAMFVMGLVGLRGGGLWAVDYALQRYTRFDTHGRYIASRPRSLSRRSVPWPGGSSVAGFIDVDNKTDSGGTRVVAIVTDSNWTAQTRLELPPAPEVHIPFAPELVVRSHANGLWFGSNERNKLYNVSLTGDTVRVVTLPRVPQAVTAAERRSALAQWQARLGKVNATASQRSQSNLPSLPKMKPLFQGIVPLANGGLGVLPYVGANDEGRVIDLFDRNGRFRGTARLPYALAGVTPVALGDQLFAVLKLPNGDQRVCILELTR